MRPCFEDFVFSKIEKFWIVLLKGAASLFGGLEYPHTRVDAFLFQINITDPNKMVCQDLDKAEVTDPKPRHNPDNDVYTPGHKGEAKKKCLKSLKKVGLKESTLAVGDAEALLTEDEESEHAWYLQRCCARTAMFRKAIEKRNFIYGQNYNNYN